MWKNMRNSLLYLLILAFFFSKLSFAGAGGGGGGGTSANNNYHISVAQSRVYPPNIAAVSLSASYNYQTTSPYYAQETQLVHTQAQTLAAPNMTQIRNIPVITPNITASPAYSQSIAAGSGNSTNARIYSPPTMNLPSYLPSYQDSGSYRNTSYMTNNNNISRSGIGSYVYSLPTMNLPSTLPSYQSAGSYRNTSYMSNNNNISSSGMGSYVYSLPTMNLSSTLPSYQSAGSHGNTSYMTNNNNMGSSGVNFSTYNGSMLSHNNSIMTHGNNLASSSLVSQFTSSSMKGTMNASQNTNIMSYKNSIPYWNTSNSSVMHTSSSGIYSQFGNEQVNPLMKGQTTANIKISTPVIHKYANQYPQHYTNELLIKFDPSVNQDQINSINKQLGVSIVEMSPYGGFYKVLIPQGMTAEEMIDRYEQESVIMRAEPNYQRDAHLIPDDIYYAYQWHLRSLSADLAWDIADGSGVVIALLDSGAAYRNDEEGTYAYAPDLKDTLIIPGQDFVNDDPYPDDDNSHGTHIAGCIAQSTNNATGVSGLAYGATIMLVKIMDANGFISIADEVDGIYYAVNEGADIINLSFGGRGISMTEQDAINYAHENGVVVISSAGNRASSILEYPASYDNVISVTALQYNDTLAPYANYGQAIDVCAPGGNVTEDQNLDGWADGILQQRHNGSDFTKFHYYFEEGTSTACALVSAIAALIIEQSPEKLTPLQIKEILEESAIDLGTEGLDQYYGAGKVNAYYALMHLTSPSAD
ncbi:MAG: S8 family serine peptidase [bacterium]